MSYSNLALVLKALGDYQGARELLEKAMRSAEQNFGAQHPTTAVRYWNLGTVLQGMKEYAGARKLYERAFKVFQHSLGESHPYTKGVVSWMKKLDQQEREDGSE